MIVVKDLHKSFGQHEILKGVNVTVNKGENVVVLGPSGCGKSTLLRCINLLEKPTSGKIIIDGIDITEKKVNANKIKQKMGMVFQNFNLFSHLTILKNIMLAPTTLHIKTPDVAKKDALNLLKRIGLEDKAKIYPSQLSGGQKQRVAIARALAMDPEIMLFDEPTSALDPEMVGEILALIKDLAKSNITMVIVTHEMNFAKKIANNILFMDNGKIIEKTPPEQFFDMPQTKRAQEFLKFNK